MDIAWDEYKPLLRRAYFGEHEGALAPRDSEVYRDFWTFHRKYVDVAVKKGMHRCIRPVFACILLHCVCRREMRQ